MANHYLRRLLTDEGHAANISAFGRERGIELFGIDIIREQWRDFLGLPKVTFSHEPETVTA